MSPNSLEAIFNKNPLELTDEEVDQIVAAERAARLNWKPEEKKKSKVDIATLGIADIADLGL